MGKAEIDAELADFEEKVKLHNAKVEDKERDFDKERNAHKAKVSSLKSNIEHIKAKQKDMNPATDQTKKQLECPVCFELMKPPKQIWQCGSGHTLCEMCKNDPEMNNCPTCREPFTGRCNIAE